jgi:hypothetical protein
MQQQHGPAASPELAPAEQAPSTGPVLLDLAQQEQVSGGSPKGGWVPPVPNAESELQGNW